MKTKVTLVGAGALGSHVVPLLRNLEIDLGIIDFDRVEAKNTLSQFHPKSAEQKNKAQALAGTMLGMWRQTIRPFPVRLGEHNLLLLQGTRVVVDAVDNAATRSLIDGYCTQNGIEVLHLAVDANGTCGQVLWRPDFRPDGAGDPEGVPTCEDGRHLPFLSLVASMGAIALQRFLLTGNKESYTIAPTSVIRVR